MPAINESKRDVAASVKEYGDLHSGDVEGRKSNYTTLVNRYYDLATEFYEYGWGQSFHFAPRFKDETFEASILRHEYYLAHRLNLQKGHKVLDVGCGIGGPLRNIARFSGAHITGLNNNDYQISRGQKLNEQAGIGATCKYLKADFMKIPFSDESFDNTYTIEASCHAPDRVACYAEQYRLLKPGGAFAGFEWCMTDSYDPKNESHQKIKKGIEIGNGLPDILTTSEVRMALKDAGFVVEDTIDLAKDSEISWYQPFEPGMSLKGFRTSAIGRKFTHTSLTVAETLRLVPQGTVTMHDYLIQGADALLEGGRTGTFTPLYFFIARKPAN